MLMLQILLAAWFGFIVGLTIKTYNKLDPDLLAKVSIFKKVQVSVMLFFVLQYLFIKLLINKESI